METCKKSVGFAVISASPSSPLPSSERLFICIPRSTFTVLYQRGDYTNPPPPLASTSAAKWRISSQNWVQFRLFLDTGGRKRTRYRHNVGVNCINKSTSNGSLRWRMGTAVLAGQGLPDEMLSGF